MAKILTEKQLREKIREEIVNSLPDDDFSNDALNGYQTDEDEAELVKKIVLDYAGEAINVLNDLCAELEQNDYVQGHQEEYSELISKANAALEGIENLVRWKL